MWIMFSCLISRQSRISCQFLEIWILLIFSWVNDCFLFFNPIQDGLFWGCSRMERGPKMPPPSIKSAAPILQWWNLAVVPYLMKIQKNINHLTHLMSSANISIFSTEISKISLRESMQVPLSTLKRFLNRPNY